MRKPLLFAGILAMLLWSLSFTLATKVVRAEDSKEEEKTKINGSVIEVAWDDDGNCKQCAIEVVDGETTTNYNIEMDDKGKELLKLIGKKVNASGDVKKDDKGNITFTMSEYTVEEEKKPE